jgi:hypothetical protein
VQRTLGRSGIAVSRLGLGTARIGGLGHSRNGDWETVMPPEAVAESKTAIRAAIDPVFTFGRRGTVCRAHGWRRLAMLTQLPHLCLVFFSRRCRLCLIKEAR